MLLAWHFNGDAATLKGWCSDAKSSTSNANATWRRTLAAVMKCQNGAVLAMAAHAMSAHFGIDIPALCVMSYMTMHSKGKVLKPDEWRKTKQRMTAGDAAHFTALIAAVENLTTEQRNRMAGSEDKMPTPPRPRAGGYKKKQFSYESLTSGAKRSNLDLPVISALAIDLTQRHGRCSSLQSKSCSRRRKWPAACSI